MSESVQAAAPRLPGVLRDRWDVLLVIAAGGALGALARWALGEAVPWSGESVPWATLAANASGSFALGVLMVLVLEVWPPRRYVRPFVGIGLLGGYTTFSTAMLETRDLAAGGRLPLATAYLSGSFVAALLAVGLGVAAARLAVRTRRRRRHEHPQPDDPRSNR